MRSLQNWFKVVKGLSPVWRSRILRKVEVLLDSTMLSSSSRLLNGYISLFLNYCCEDFWLCISPYNWKSLSFLAALSRIVSHGPQWLQIFITNTWDQVSYPAQKGVWFSCSHDVYFSFYSILNEVQVIFECFALDSCSCWCASFLNFWTFIYHIWRSSDRTGLLNWSNEGSKTAWVGGGRLGVSVYTQERPVIRPNKNRVVCFRNFKIRGLEVIEKQHGQTEEFPKKSLLKIQDL